MDDELMDIEKVQDELKDILREFEALAYDDASYDLKAEAIAAALEYLWMYEDLME